MAFSFEETNDRFKIVFELPTHPPQREPLGQRLRRRRQAREPEGSCCSSGCSGCLCSEEADDTDAYDKDFHIFIRRGSKGSVPHWQAGTPVRRLEEMCA